MKKKAEQPATKPSSDTTSASNSPTQSGVGSGNPANPVHLQSNDDSGQNNQPNPQTQGAVGSGNHPQSGDGSDNQGPVTPTSDSSNPTSALSPRDWDDLEKRYWDDIELDARGYNDLDDLR